MLKLVKPENLPTYINKVESIFPEFKKELVPDIEYIKRYYKESYWGYAFFHSWAGAIHMALSKNGEFSKNDYFRQAEEVANIIELAPAKSIGRILEVGCGRGFNLAYLAERFPKVQFLGRDIGPHNVRSAANRLSLLPNADIKVDDFNKLSTVDAESIDLVLAVETLCHASDIDLALAKIASVMTSQATLIVFDGFRSDLSDSNDLTLKAVRYTEQAMAVAEFQNVSAFLAAATRAGLRAEFVEDRSQEIMPNLLRLSDLAKSFFKVPAISRVILQVIPRALAANAIAGLLMAVTVQTGAHKYMKIVLRKG